MAPLASIVSGPTLSLDDLTPRQIVAELDKYVVGQHAAKRAVAIALRNRWRRQQLDPEMAEEVLPKNILMIGPTGVGKTEIARRLARLAKAPFLQGRGEQVHRGRLRRPRCGVHGARPRGGGGRDGTRGNPSVCLRQGRRASRGPPPAAARTAAGTRHRQSRMRPILRPHERNSETSCGRESSTTARSKSRSRTLRCPASRCSLRRVSRKWESISRR